MILKKEKLDNLQTKKRILNKNEKVSESIKQYHQSSIRMYFIHINVYQINQAIYNHFRLPEYFISIKESIFIRIYLKYLSKLTNEINF